MSICWWWCKGGVTFSENDIIQFCLSFVISKLLALMIFLSFTCSPGSDWDGGHKLPPKFQICLFPWLQWILQVQIWSRWRKGGNCLWSISFLKFKVGQLTFCLNELSEDVFCQRLNGVREQHKACSGIKSGTERGSFFHGVIVIITFCVWKSDTFQAGGFGCGIHCSCGNHLHCLQMK